MVEPEYEITPKPIFLYYDPHPVHEKMASYVNAEMVQCETGTPIDRIRAGRNHDFGNRPVILEGGVPLAEGAALKTVGTSGPLIALGADSTYHDIVDPMPSRSRTSRLTHRVAQRFVDGTLAVSDRIATIADQLTDGPVRITHPFIETDRYSQLREMEPSLGGSRILCVGKYREKNGQDILVRALPQVDTNVTFDFVGPDTTDLPKSDQIKTHGFVSEEQLLELFESASLMVFPAPVGAFPVATLEGLCAGLPVVTTPGVGTATLIRGVNGRLISDPMPYDLAQTIDWYFSLPDERRNELGNQAACYGAGFDEEAGLEAFAFELTNLLTELEYNATITNV
ncbi:glycosyltransferase family 4 protein [Haloterrigena salifodinae]|uniref:Glycosyltransferase family 4 protein n=1 Tax=Haloterrigena salifodinae TaxID=2675099 RepID=A0A8T8DXU9_9EURY|nr:glycosyltransferase family 4 protein [Haloterrigena salifodinae]QRV13986.1 glycosyltransferase family 4 protein [Haloterrigena salifodinae]